MMVRTNPVNTENTSKTGWAGVGFSLPGPLEKYPANYPKRMGKNMWKKGNRHLEKWKDFRYNILNGFTTEPSYSIGTEGE